MRKENKTIRRNNRYTVLTDIKRNPFSYLLIIPTGLYTLLFGYLTLPYVFIAFQKFNYKTGLFGSEFIGIKNFAFFFDSPKFFEVSFNTIVLNFLFIVCGTTFAIFFAILLSETKGKLFSKISQSTFLLPYFMSWIVVSYIVYILFASDYGLLNKAIIALGGKPVSWYSDPKYWRIILVLIRIWKDTGMSMVIYLAVITGMDGSLAEAARIDGASRRQVIRFITLPLLVPTISILTLMSVGKIFYGDFGMIYAIIKDNGVLFPTTDVIDTYVFRALRKTGDPSQAMAVGVYQSMMGCIFVFITNFIAKRKIEGGALF